jgi:hypothetical protein
VDPYVFTHVTHGLGFYALARLFRIPPRWRLVAVIGIECAWEVFENTPFVIERYRAATISLDYYGDSVLNSLADIAACAGGYALAARWPWRVTLAVFVVLEGLLVLLIRDNLTLNVWMLIWPIEAVRRWQRGARDR